MPITTRLIANIPTYYCGSCGQPVNAHAPTCKRQTGNWVAMLEAQKHVEVIWDTRFAA